MQFMDYFYRIIIPFPYLVTTKDNIIIFIDAIVPPIWDWFVQEFLFLCRSNNGGEEIL